MSKGHQQEALGEGRQLFSMQFDFPEFLSSPARGEKANTNDGLCQPQRPVIGAGGTEL